MRQAKRKMASMPSENPSSDRDRQVIAATLKRALPDLKRHGRGCPAIMTIITTGGGKYVTVLSSSTFAEFEHDMHFDQQAVDDVRSAMAANPDRFIIVMIADTREIVYLAASRTEMEKEMEQMTTDDSWLDEQTIFYRDGRHGERG